METVLGSSQEDAGKKIEDRKRHLLTDTAGNFATAVAHEAHIQDRDGALAVLARSARSIQGC